MRPVRVTSFLKERWRELGGFNEKIFTCPDLDFMLRATLKGPIAVIASSFTESRQIVC
jgi:hypothetical protein